MIRPAACLATALAVAFALGSAAVAAPGRIAVGLDGGADPDAVALELWRTTGSPVDRTLEEVGAFVVEVADVQGALAALDGIRGVEYLEHVVPERRLAFAPNDPLVFFQWYLNAVRAFEYWETRPVFGPVKVAVIDSGIDSAHPEFAGRIAASASFTQGRASLDIFGHGTLVAGEIAATLDNAEGIAGISFPAQLLVAKVVSPTGGISIEAEAQAIKWAIDQGARVINLSLSGSTYDPLEHDAINYAYRKGAVIVAAIGNCGNGVSCGSADYPAALPHVLGVSAINQSSKRSSFSKRDGIFNDLAAPGEGIVSTFPAALTNKNCGFPGYSHCAVENARLCCGTSFAAPIVAAAASLLIAQRPDLHASQVMTLLELTAVDIAGRGRDPATGNGRLDIPQALAAAVTLPPPADRYETNDDAGKKAWTIRSPKPRIDATIDYFDDPSDVYRVYLRAGRRVKLILTGPKGTKPTLILWRPGTKEVTPITQIAVRSGAVLRHKRRPNPSFSYRVRTKGWYFVEVRASENERGGYRLVIRK